MHPPLQKPTVSVTGSGTKREQIKTRSFVDYLPYAGGRGSMRKVHTASFPKTAGFYARSYVDWVPFAGWSQSGSSRAQCLVDAGLPAWACCAEGGDDVLVEAQRDGLFERYEVLWRLRHLYKIKNKEGQVVTF